MAESWPPALVAGGLNFLALVKAIECFGSLLVWGVPPRVSGGT